MIWDYTKTEYKKQAEHDPRWRLERLITHGLHGEKLPRGLLRRHIKHLVILEDRRAFLELLLWDKQFSRTGKRR